MTAQSIQAAFLSEVRKHMPPHVAFADELAEILSISRDSAYRRLRGETVLSLDEVTVLCSRFSMSVDEVINPSSEMVSFHNRFVTEKGFTFELWLKSIEGNLDHISASAGAEMIVAAKDLPIFYYFISPMLSPFKMFFWMKSVLGYVDHKDAKFQPDKISKSLLALGARIHDKYLRQQRIELWSEDTIHASMRQIEFYYDCGFFEHPAHALQLCDELVSLLHVIRDRAADAGVGAGELNLFKNDIIIADNTILFIAGESRRVFINHNTLNVLTTQQPAFCKQTEHYLRHLLNKATKISGSGEKDRLRFFNILEEKVRHLKKRISEKETLVGDARY